MVLYLRADWAGTIVVVHDGSDLEPRSGGRSQEWSIDADVCASSPSPLRQCDNRHPGKRGCHSHRRRRKPCPDRPPPADRAVPQPRFGQRRHGRPAPEQGFRQQRRSASLVGDHPCVELGHSAVGHRKLRRLGQLLDEYTGRIDRRPQSYDCRSSLDRSRPHRRVVGRKRRDSDQRRHLRIWQWSSGRPPHRSWNSPTSWRPGEPRCHHHRTSRRRLCHKRQGKPHPPTGVVLSSARLHKIYTTQSRGSPPPRRRRNHATHSTWPTTPSPAPPLHQRSALLGRHLSLHPSRTCWVARRVNWGPRTAR
jgi:hypothetical protein